MNNVKTILNNHGIGGKLEENTTKDLEAFICEERERATEETIEAVKLEFKRGCTRDEVVPRLDELFSQLKGKK